MRRFVAAGVILEVALLIVGLTWVGPLADRDGGAEAAAPAGSANAAEAFRLEGQGTGNVVEVDLVAEETTQTLADGVEYQTWTFNGTAPGPVIRVQLGDTVRFTLRNDSKLGLSHSIDFHAAQTPWSVNYQPVAPGETLTFDWVARFPGVFLYHCGVPPVLHHIANGMYGAIIVEPEGLQPAREFVLTSSEFYPTDKPGPDGVYTGDMVKMEAADPTYVVFDGKANRYLDAPLQVRPDELVRIWVVNAGPTLTNAFHVIGALFDHVFPDGNPTNVLNGVQTYNVPPGGGTMFELRIPDEGLYPFVTHSFAYTGLGAVGVVQVTADAPEPPADYPTLGDPFTAGVLEFGSTPAVVESGADGGGDAQEGPVPIDATITGFSPGDIEVTEGEVSLAIANLDAFEHDFTIDELGVQLAVGANETVEGSFEAAPGTYTFYCSIPGHREAGMEGTITVVPAGGH
ncbi:MAG TPA: multicopper oxidase domain-containing protein [Actinomycetota bacterium]|nr:multicopper oxidase domain-containing protein [Actinomycetota bacterium]